jgi:hypothetical protein
MPTAQKPMKSETPHNDQMMMSPMYLPCPPGLTEEQRREFDGARLRVHANMLGRPSGLRSSLAECLDELEECLLDRAAEIDADLALGRYGPTEDEGSEAAADRDRLAVSTLLEVLRSRDYFDPKSPIHHEGEEG